MRHLTKAQAHARSRKGWETRRRAVDWTPAQRKHYREFYNTGLKQRLVRDGQCRSCWRRREKSRRHVQECARCAKVTAARNRRNAGPRRSPLVMRTAA